MEDRINDNLSKVSKVSKTDHEILSIENNEAIMDNEVIDEINISPNEKS